MRTNNPPGRALALVAALAFIQACSDPKSSSTGGPDGGPVPTSRISLFLNVEASDSDTAVVRANLNDGRAFGRSYRLDGGDFMRACIGAICRTMSDNDSVFTPDYIARFDYQPGIDYVVSFNRQEGQAAPNSRVSLPQPFTIVTPADRQQVTDGESVQVSWSPTGEPAAVDLTYLADCRFSGGSTSVSSGTLSEDSNADGSESVSIDPIIAFARSNAAGVLTRCSIDVIVRHELEGRVDPAFDDGVALGVVSRKVTLNYIPR